MTMNKNLVSFTWSVLRLSSLCGLALALTGMTPAKTAKACYQTYWLYGSYCLCQTSSAPARLRRVKTMLWCKCQPRSEHLALRSESR